MNAVQAVLDKVDPASLLDERSVQGRRESGVSILVHVVDHFSYHVGQVSYFVTSHKGIDLNKEIRSEVPTTRG